MYPSDQEVETRTPKRSLPALRQPAPLPWLPVWLVLDCPAQCHQIKKDLVNWVRKEIGPIASPDFIQFSPNLPKTRSGKIMRRILRKIAANDYDDLGDTSTLAEPKVIDDLIENKQNLKL